MIETTIFIDPLALQKINFWVQKAAHNEVSGFGKVITDDGVAYIRDVFLVKQTNTMGSTVIDANALAKAAYEYRELPGELNFWWHSHGHGAVFWSGTDESTIVSLGANGYLVAAVFNTRREIKTAVYTALPIRAFTDATLRPHILLAGTTSEEWSQSYDAMVTTVVPRTRARNRTSFRRFDNWRARDNNLLNEGDYEGVGYGD